MKICKIATVYQAYWKNFYTKKSELNNKSYALQKEALDYDGFGWSDFWQHALTELGYNVMEIIANIEPLQKMWSIEHDFKFSQNSWILSIAFEQVKTFQPTVLFLDDYSTFSNRWIAELRQACPSIQLVISWCGAPYQNSDIFKAHDFVLSCIPELVEQFRKMGHCSNHINHAFDSRILERLPPITEPQVDCSFVGQIVRNNQYHLERERVLEQLAAQLPIQIYCPATGMNWKDQAKAMISRGVYEGMQVLQQLGISKTWLSQLPKIGKLAACSDRPRLPINPRLQPFMWPAVFGLEMFQTLQNSKTTFNSHINISPRSASNMRLFEATGVGSCLVTDWKDNIRTLFEPDTEVVTYRTAEECVEKVRWLLDHPDQRATIAQAGQARTLKDHTFTHRAIQLHELITETLKKS